MTDMSKTICKLLILNDLNAEPECLKQAFVLSQVFCIIYKQNIHHITKINTYFLTLGRFDANTYND